MVSSNINKMPKKNVGEDDEDVGARLSRMEEILKVMDKKVETYNSEIKREIYSIKPSYASLTRELNASAQSGLVPAVVRPQAGFQGGHGAEEPMEQGQPLAGAGLGDSLQHGQGGPHHQQG